MQSAVQCTELYSVVQCPWKAHRKKVAGQRRPREEAAVEICFTRQVCDPLGAEEEGNCQTGRKGMNTNEIICVPLRAITLLDEEHSVC